MISVELDIFSGRPNPRWFLSDAEEMELVNRILENRALICPTLSVKPSWDIGALSSVYMIPRARRTKRRPKPE